MWEVSYLHGGLPLPIVFAVRVICFHTIRLVVIGINVGAVDIVRLHTDILYRAELTARAFTLSEFRELNATAIARTRLRRA